MIDSHLDLFWQDSTRKELSISFESGEILTNSNIVTESMEIIESICSEQQLKFGACEASSFKIKIGDIFTSHSGQKFTASINITDSSTPFLIGTYTVVSDTPTADRRYRELVAYDKMYDILNTDVTEWYNSLFSEVSSSITFKQFRDSFFTYLGVTQENKTFSIDSITVEKTISGTIYGKNIVTAICELVGCFGHISRNGIFKYVQLSNTSPITIDKSKYRNPVTYEDYSVKTIDVLQIKSESDDLGVSYPESSESNVYTISNNFLLYGKSTSELIAIAQLIYPTISNISYMPASVTMRGNLCIEVGDRFTVPTRYATINTYCLQRTITGIQALKDDIVATGLEYYTSADATQSEQITKLKYATNKLTKSIEETKSELTQVHQYATTVANEALANAKAYTDNEATAIRTDTSAITQRVDGISVSVQSNTQLIGEVSESVSQVTESVNQLDTFYNALLDNIESIQNQVDGQIETWYLSGIPTLSNEPANSWITTDDRDNHIGDLYYDKTSGYSYRFMKEDSTYSWALIQDSDITTAIARAETAQTTANGKRRIFTVQPIPPYDVGDLWVQGASGDILTCNTARSSDAYISSDWVLASKYTDDTAANAVADNLSNNYYTKSEINVQNNAISLIVEANGQLSASAKEIAEQAKAESSSASSSVNDMQTRMDSGEFRGENGETPVKGVDYFTDAEITAIENNAAQTAKDSVETEYGEKIDLAIKSTVREYYVSTSSSVPTGGTWSTTFPMPEDNEYLWIRTANTLNNGTVNYTPSQNGILDVTWSGLASVKAQMQLKIGRIELSLTDNSGTLASVTLKADATNAGNLEGVIDLSGKVVFSDALSTAGKTVINGANITTGVMQDSAGNVVFDLVNGTLAIKQGSINLGDGKFTVDNTGTLTATSGNIGGLNISASELSYSSTVNGTERVVSLRPGTNANKDFLVVRNTTNGVNSYPFYVRADGKLYAENAEITGSINANVFKFYQNGYTMTMEFLNNGILDFSTTLDNTVDALGWLQITTEGVNVGGDLTVDNVIIGGNISSSNTANPVEINGALSVAKKITSTNTDTALTHTNGKAISFGVGSGKDNRGLWNNSANAWLMYTSGTDNVARFPTKVIVGAESSAEAQIRVQNSSYYGGYIYCSTSGGFGLWSVDKGTSLIRIDTSGFVYTRTFTSIEGYPIVSDTTDKNRVARMSSRNSSSGTKYLKVWAQWASSTGTTVKDYDVNSSSSDIRLKQDIANTEVVNALSIINQIKMRSFTWKDSGIHQRIGFIADELETLDEALIFGNEENPEDYKSVNTFYLLGYLTKAIQELSAQVEELKGERI